MQDPNPPGPTLQHSRGPRGEPPDPADAPFALERLAVLSHELNNLLDGSLRCLGMARRSLMGLPTHAVEVDGARRQLDTVYGALERMADLVNAAMRGTSAVVGSPALSPKRAITLAEAVTHAADVVYPEAQELGVTVRVDLAAAVGPLPIGPLYSVLLNGLRNALESIAMVQQAAGKAPKSGSIEITGRRRPLGSRRGAFDLIELEIRDDGAGLGAIEDPARAFSFGYSTKPGGLGVGLALAREIVGEIGGTVELLRREPALPAPRPGAVLRICYPVARDQGRP